MTFCLRIRLRLLPRPRTPPRVVLVYGAPDPFFACVLAACRYKLFNPAGAFVKQLPNELLSPRVLYVPGVHKDHADAMTWARPKKNGAWLWGFAGFAEPTTKTLTAMTAESDFYDSGFPPPDEWRAGKDNAVSSNIRLTCIMTLPDGAPAAEEGEPKKRGRSKSPDPEAERKRPRIISHKSWLKRQAKWKTRQLALKKEVERKTALVDQLKAEAKELAELPGYVPEEFTLLQASYDGSGPCVGIPSFLVDLGSQYGAAAKSRQAAVRAADNNENDLDPRDNGKGRNKKQRYQWSSEWHENKALYAAAKGSDGAHELMVAGIKAGLINCDE